MKKTKDNQQKTITGTTPVYQCPVCGLHYRNVRLAQACQKFCMENSACSLEITRAAVESEQQHEG